ncbi:MAG TPA: response regulator [Terriglobales bacterium]|jgi:CheY-like chemotaxis protein|nr:response regulator [Terriglobales bacterium]
MQPKKNILVVDDDRVLVAWMSEQLRARGFNVVVGFDAMQAIMAAQRTPLSAVLLDVQMPGGTGLEVLKRLKSSTKTRNVPIIVVTGSIEPDFAWNVTALGADAVLFKPVEFDELHHVLCQSMDKSYA